VKVLCSVLRVSRSGFYAWRTRPESKRAARDRVLGLYVRAAFRQHRGRCGSPRLHRELRAQGEAVSRKRIARLMRSDGLVARRRRRFRVTTDSRHGLRCAPNLVARRFSTGAPNRVWVSDITYLWTEAGWAYLACVLDLGSRRIVGWSLERHLEAKLALDALRAALAHRRPRIHHSDRGVQYASYAYRAELRRHRIQSSMSRKGNCWDNAVMESFFSTLKQEINPLRFDTVEHARREIALYIDYYNTNRRHSALQYLSPLEYELKSAVP
jgi:putative transposase